MAKKEKVIIQKDKRMEPIDNELDEAMGLLDNANRQITDLLASFVPPTVAEGAEIAEGDPKTEAQQPEKASETQAEAAAAEEKSE
jgi:hypothetical protein